MNTPLGGGVKSGDGCMVGEAELAFQFHSEPKITVNTFYCSKQSDWSLRGEAKGAGPLGPLQLSRMWLVSRRSGRPQGSSQVTRHRLISRCLPEPHALRGGALGS